MKHFLCTMDGPDSSYSCFEIHICWKVEREARIDPPIQTEYFLSGGAITLIFMVLGARAVISFCILSAMPGYIVVPPDKTELGCLRAIVLYTPDAKGLVETGKVEQLRERVYASLEDYVRTTTPNETGRFAKVLLRLPALRSIGLRCDEHLFFFKMITDTQGEFDATSSGFEFHLKDLLDSSNKFNINSSNKYNSKSRNKSITTAATKSIKKQ